ncbi:hypothetical protein [Enterobacter sp. Bisph1]|uniref:hypothetical protein n=1 Tax=Enterobacter sp. Bisph1 TaxID=1274399 RepID=UPI00057BED89|nr:hypothetical protein [Enterobacter sp. Bisph1]
MFSLAELKHWALFANDPNTIHFKASDDGFMIHGMLVFMFLSKQLLAIIDTQNQPIKIDVFFRKKVFTGQDVHVTSPSKFKVSLHSGDSNNCASGTLSFTDGNFFAAKASGDTALTRLTHGDIYHYRSRFAKAFNDYNCDVLFYSAVCFRYLLNSAWFSLDQGNNDAHKQSLFDHYDVIHIFQSLEVTNPFTYSILTSCSLEVLIFNKSVLPQENQSYLVTLGYGLVDAGKPMLVMASRFYIRQKEA